MSRAPRRSRWVTGPVVADVEGLGRGVEGDGGGSRGSAAGPPSGPAVRAGRRLSRRRFLALGAGAAGAGAVSALASWSGGPMDAGAPPTADPAARAPAGAAPERERLLVVVELAGGNDALNTLVPVAGRYRDLRGAVAVPEDLLIPVGGRPDVAMHPALEPLVDLFDAGRAAWVTHVGYPRPDRSHFVSMERWWTASPDRPVPTGWLGRWRDTLGGERPPLEAVAIGGSGRSLTGGRTRPVVTRDGAGLRFRAPGDPDAARAVAGALADIAADPAATSPAGEVAAGLRDAIGAVEAMAAVAGDGSGAAPGRAPDVGAAFELAAGLLTGATGTRVVVITVGGFDTHAAQGPTHERLLGAVASGIRRLVEVADGAGRGGDLLVMTTSEFGRRAAANGSGGTDHGSAGTHLVVAPSVVEPVVGTIDLDRLTDGDLATHVDVRALCAVALTWLDAPAEEVLGGRFTDPGVLG